MPGTKEGGLKTAQKLKEMHGKDYYKKIGKLGGQASNTGGFAADKELASKAGRKGGKNRWKNVRRTV